MSGSLFRESYVWCNDVMQEHNDTLRQEPVEIADFEVTHYDDGMVRILFLNESDETIAARELTVNSVTPEEIRSMVPEDSVLTDAQVADVVSEARKPIASKRPR